MIILISGTTHTGKTALSQRLMEKYKIPYFSIDHLKMGLIRSNKTSLTADDDEKLTPYLTRIDSRNGLNLHMCKKYGLEYILIDKNYKIEIEL